MKRLLLIFVLLLSSLAGAATYYVDCNAADDTGNGTSTGTAWKTINKVNTSSFSAGDSILFNKGCTWREQLTVPSSGSAGNVITFGAYGTGAKPIITGGNQLTSFTTEVVSTENFTDGTGSKPVSWWLLAETGANARVDANGGANDLTAVNSPTRVTGPVGPLTTIQYGVQLAVASSQALTRTDANLSAGFPAKNGTTSSDFTLGAWVNPTTNAATDGIIDKSCCAYRLAVDGGYFKGLLWDTGYAAHEVTSNATAPLGSWSHVVLRWIKSSGAIALFVNGIKQTSTATSATLQIGDGAPFSIGNSGTGAYLNGSIAAPFIFASALSDAQILDIYNGGLAGYSFTAYYKSLAADPGQVFDDGSYLVKSATKLGMATGTQWYDTPNTRIYVRLPADADPASHTMEAMARDSAIAVTDKSYVTIDGLELREAKKYGLGVATSSGALSNITIQNSNVYWNGIGVNLNGTSTLGISAFNFTGNDISDNFAHGIMIQNKASSGTVSLNTVRRNGWDFAQNPSGTDWPLAGIRVIAYTTSLIDTTNRTLIQNVVVENNEISSNGLRPIAGTAGSADYSILHMGYGLHFDSIDSCTARYNKVFSNLTLGIELENDSNCKVYGNVIYNNTGGTYPVGLGIYRENNGNLIYNNSIYGSATAIQAGTDTSTNIATSGFVNNVFKNNIAIGTSFSLYATTGGQNDGTNGSGNVYTYNALGPEAASFIQWGASSYSTYATWNGATGAGAGVTDHYVSGDPLFTNAGSADFTLQAGSPAINAGANLGSTYQMGLDPRTSFPWLTLNQDSHGSGWEIGAFVYYVAGAHTGTGCGFNDLNQKISPGVCQ